MGFNPKSLKTDSKKEVDGVWVPFFEGSRVRVARMGNPRYQQYLWKLGKPVRGRLRRDNVPVSEVNDMQSRAAARYILLDWEGFVEDDGATEIPYTNEKSLEYMRMPDFSEAIYEIANDLELFKEDEDEAVVKNSLSGSNGGGDSGETQT